MKKNNIIALIILVVLSTACLLDQYVRAGRGGAFVGGLAAGSVLGALASGPRHDHIVEKRVIVKEPRRQSTTSPQALRELRKENDRLRDDLYELEDEIDELKDIVRELKRENKKLKKQLDTKETKK